MAVGTRAQSTAAAVSIAVGCIAVGCIEVDCIEAGGKWGPEQVPIGFVVGGRVAR